MQFILFVYLCALVAVLGNINGVMLRVIVLDYDILVGFCIGLKKP